MTLQLHAVPVTVLLLLALASATAVQRPDLLPQTDQAFQVQATVDGQAIGLVAVDWTHQAARLAIWRNSTTGILYLDSKFGETCHYWTWSPSSACQSGDVTRVSDKVILGRQCHGFKWMHIDGATYSTYIAEGSGQIVQVVDHASDSVMQYLPDTYKPGVPPDALLQPPHGCPPIP